MKIGIDIRCLMNSKYSGVSWYAYNLLKNIFELDHDNHYVLFYNSSKQVILPKFDYDNVKYSGCRYPNKLFNLVVNCFNYPRIDKLIGGVDLFFVPNLHFIAWSDNCKKIITVHDLSFLHFPEFFTAKMRLWHKLILKKDILGQADLIVADSFNTKNDLLGLLGVPENKIKVIHLGVDQRYFIPSTAEQLAAIRKKYDLPDKFVLSLGTLEPRKNLEGIVAAYKSLAPEADLVIAGGRGWKTKPSGSQSSADRRINFIGYVAEADKPALYQLASVLVYPSFYEGFGLPLLEAMASGCPVIAGSNSAQPEVVGEAGLLVDPNNISEISSALAVLLSDGRFHQEMSKRGKKQAANFSWLKTAQETLEAFNTLNSYL